MSGEAPVSVIVAVRNGAAHLGGALDSVLGQVPALQKSSSSTAIRRMTVW